MEAIVHPHLGNSVRTPTPITISTSILVHFRVISLVEIAVATVHNELT